jgi:phosphoglycerate dehydrogenase-like enzyme
MLLTFCPSEGSVISDEFKVGITRDFIGPDGRMSYKDIGLGLLEREPGCAYHFFDEHLNPVSPGQIAECDAVLALTPGWKPETFAHRADRLLIVARFGVGYDMCDVAAMTANNVLLTITPGATDQPVAGGVLAMILALSRRLFIKDRLVREARWNERANYMGSDISGKTLGIVGFGGAGKRLRELVSPFEMRVLAFDPMLPDTAFADKGVQRAQTLDELFAASDYISIHCPLNEMTKGLIDKRLFELMKPTAYFFNTARGPIVNEADLIDALQSGRIAGAGIDCFEQEPPAWDNPLFKLDNVILAPHAVAWTDECFAAIGASAVRSILSIKRGEAPFGLLNPEVLERKGFLDKKEAMLERIETAR